MKRYTEEEVRQAIKILQEQPGVKILGLTIRQIAELSVHHANEVHEDTLREAKKILDDGYSVEARFKEIPRRWVNAGNVTHTEAARWLCSHSAQPPGVYEVETRVRGKKEVLFPHTVKVALTVDVTTHRQD